MTLSLRTSARAALGGLALGTMVWLPTVNAAHADADIVSLVERVSPSVVTILVTQTGTEEGPRERMMPHGSPFDQFMRRFGNPDRHEEERQGLGSGFVIEADGYLVTNFHVVENANSVRVRFSDAREFTAEVVGTDRQTDLALLKIDAKGLTPLVLGDSDAVKVGQDVIAVGNPFGLGGTVTRGIISALARDIANGPYVDFIQTDAAINRGNSGGPLFNMAGEVIGVNSAIFSPNGGSIGLGFAIPSNVVKQITAQLKKDGKVERGWLGVAIQPVTPDLAEALGLDAAKGALVADVMDDGPSRGILQPGDVILNFDGKPVPTSRDLPKVVGATESGKDVAVAILRDGKPETVRIQIGKLEPREASLRDEDGTNRPATVSEKIGATLAPLDAEIRDRLGLDRDAAGVVVTSLRSGGIAEEAGLQVGDVIVKAGAAEVRNPRDLMAALSGKKDAATLLQVERDGRRVFVALRAAS